MDLQYDSFSYLKTYIILFSTIVYSVSLLFEMIMSLIGIISKEQYLN